MAQDNSLLCLPNLQRVASELSTFVHPFDVAEPRFKRRHIRWWNVSPESCIKLYLAEALAATYKGFHALPCQGLALYHLHCLKKTLQCMSFQTVGEWK